ncbi:MAG: class I SAM-dependent methyltransferase [Pseudonocardiales bacterium]
MAADVGSGAGHLTVALAQLGRDVVAVDAAESMLEQVLSNAAQAGVAARVRPVTSQAQELGLASATCAAVIAIGLLPWVEQPALAVAEMARITKPGGHVIVTMDNTWSVARGLDPVWHASVRRLITTCRRLLARRMSERPPSLWPASANRGDLDRLLRAAGLIPLEFTGIGFGPFTFLGRAVVPNNVGLRLDSRLQRLAERRLPSLAHAAVFTICLAVKPAEETATDTDAPVKSESVREAVRKEG